MPVGLNFTLMLLFYFFLHGLPLALAALLIVKSILKTVKQV